MRAHLPFRGLLIGLFLWLNNVAVLQAQSLDATFQATTLKAPFGSVLQSGVNVLAVQPDGKIIVAGGFDFVNGALVGKLQRLNADGTTDATFNVGGTGANGFIAGVVLQPDGKILVGGGFNSFNGQQRSFVVRLNTNGSLDAGFSLDAAFIPRQVSSLALQPDGKILVGSAGAALGGGPPPPAIIARLLPTGAIDSSFNPGSNGTGPGIVSAILVQPDGNIVIGGSFLGFNGQSLNNLLRLTPTGALDPNFAFNTPAINRTSLGSVSALVRYPDGRLLVTGLFGLSPQTGQRVVRLLSDGTPDGNFQPGTGPNNAVRSLALDANDNIIIGGAFTQVDGVARNRVARLTSTGTLDTSYGDLTGANGTVNAVALTAGGQVLVGGIFTQVSSRTNTAGLVRLGAGTGLPDPGFASVIEARGTISQVAPLPNGQLLVAGNFTQFNGLNAPGTATSVRRVNTDGTLDQSFVVPAVGSGTIQVLPNGNFYVGLTRVLASGAVDNSFFLQQFGPLSGANPGQLSGLLPLPNGQVLAFGRFTSYGAVTGLGGIIRLNADGTPDNTFVSASSSGTRRTTQVLRQPSGKLLLLTDDSSAPFVTLLSRLNADGTADNTFSVGTAAGPGGNYSVLMQPDGRLIISTGSTSFNGQPIPYGLTRLTIDGAPDPTFSGLTASYGVRAVQPDGRLLVTTSATFLTFTNNTLRRLNSDGSLDGSFSPVALPTSIFIGDDILSGVVLQPTDGKILLYGSFRYVAGQPRIGLARLANIGLATRAATALRPLALYPNPAQAAITIGLPSAAQPRPATLLDLNGRPVRRWTVPARQAETRLSLEAVAAGVYLLQVRGEDAVYQQKVVVAP